MARSTKTFRRDRATDLQTVGMFLQKTGICHDISSIESAAVQCRTKEPMGKDSWGYSLSRLLFKFPLPKKTKPDNTSTTLNLELNVDLKGYCAPDSWDCLSKLSVDIEISGTDKENHKLVNAWHFDRHLWNVGDGEPKEIHPLYHCHHGGRGMAALENLGNVLLLSAPRLVHPPMDAILAIDFVLSNFLPDFWKKLRDENTYLKRLFNSQQLILVPYFDKILSEIKEPSKTNPGQLWPTH